MNRFHNHYSSHLFCITILIYYFENYVDKLILQTLLASESGYRLKSQDFLSGHHYLSPSHIGSLQIAVRKICLNALLFSALSD